MATIHNCHNKKDIEMLRIYGDITNAVTYIDCITTTYNFVNNPVTGIDGVYFVYSFLEVILF